MLRIESFSKKYQSKLSSFFYCHEQLYISENIGSASLVYDEIKIIKWDGIKSWNKSSMKQYFPIVLYFV